MVVYQDSNSLLVPLSEKEKLEDHAEAETDNMCKYPLLVTIIATEELQTLKMVLTLKVKIEAGVYFSEMMGATEKHITIFTD